MRNVFKIQGISNLRNSHIGRGKQFLGTEITQVHLVLRRRYPGVSLECTTEPRITDMQLLGNILDRYRIVDVGFHDFARLVNLPHHIRFHKSKVLFLVIDFPHQVQHNTGDKLLVSAFFLNSMCDNLFIQTDYRGIHTDFINRLLFREETVGNPALYQIPLEAYPMFILA